MLEQPLTHGIERRRHHVARAHRPEIVHHEHRTFFVQLTLLQVYIIYITAVDNADNGYYFVYEWILLSLISLNIYNIIIINRVRAILRFYNG